MARDLVETKRKERNKGTERKEGLSGGSTEAMYPARFELGCAEEMPVEGRLFDGKSFATDISSGLQLREADIRRTDLDIVEKQ